MKTRSAQTTFKSAAAFTLTEILMVTVIFSFLVGGLVCANLFGLRSFHIAQTKLGATDQSRRVLGQMSDEIRNAKALWIGNITNGAFVGHLDGEPQTGNGLLVHPTTNSANFVLYYVHPADQTFRRTSSAEGTTILARSVANTTVFRAQDFQGSVLTNNQSQRLIHACLEFFHPQSQLPLPDYYKLETSVARRTE